MNVKLTTLGLLILGAMAAYLVAAVLLLLRQRAAGRAVFAVGFALAAAAFGLRWH